MYLDCHCRDHEKSNSSGQSICRPGDDTTTGDLCPWNLDSPLRADRETNRRGEILEAFGSDHHIFGLAGFPILRRCEGIIALMPERIGTLVNQKQLSKHAVPTITRAVSDMRSPDSIQRREVFLLGFLMVFYGLLVRRLEDESFWKLLLVGLLMSVWARWCWLIILHSHDCCLKLL